MTEEQATTLVSEWLNKTDKLVRLMDDRGFHVFAHIMADASMMVQDEALGLIINDKPMRNLV